MVLLQMLQLFTLTTMVAAGTPNVENATLALVQPGNPGSSKSGRPVLMVGREELGKAQQLPVALHLFTFQHRKFII